MKEFIEKLIEMLEEKQAEAENEMHRLRSGDYTLPCSYDITDIKEIASESFKESIQIVNQLAEEYKDAEEQGLLLRLPCKVGSTLYQPISNRINEYKVIGLCFDITRNEWMYQCAYQIGLEWYKTTCDFDNINKTVFLTKEEAEQALKEKGERE